MATQSGKSKRNKETPKKAVNNNFVKLSVHGHKQAEAHGRVPTMLTKHLYQQNELTLFTEEEERERDLKIAQKAEIFSFLNKKSVFDNSTIRTLFSLCYCLTKDNDDDIFEFSKLSSTTMAINESQYVTREIPIKEFVKFMFGSRNLHENSLGVIKDVIRLSSIPVSWTYERIDDEGNPQTWKKIAPFLRYEIDIPVEGDNNSDSVLEKIYNQGTMRITVGRALLHNVEKRFASIPKALITEWGKEGTQNELFPVLLNELLSLIGNYRFHALKLRERLQAEHRKNKIPKSESDKILKEKIKKMLTVRILFQSIADNSVSDYAKKRRWNRMRDLIDKNMRFFRDKIELITEYHIEGKGSKQAVEFVFNLDYNSSKDEE